MDDLSLSIGVSVLDALRMDNDHDLQYFLGRKVKRKFKEAGYLIHWDRGFPEKGNVLTLLNGSPLGVVIRSESRRPIDVDETIYRLTVRSHGPVSLQTQVDQCTSGAEDALQAAALGPARSLGVLGVRRSGGLGAARGSTQAFGVYLGNSGETTIGHWIDSPYATTASVMPVAMGGGDIPVSWRRRDVLTVEQSRSSKAWRKKERRAEELFAELVGKKEYKLFRKKKYHELFGKTGQRYRLRLGQMISVMEGDKGNKEEMKLCVHHSSSKHMPDMDTLIHQMMCIQTEEVELWKKGNKQK